MYVCISWHLCFTSRPATEERTYNYWKADYPAIREKLSSINWKLEFENKAVNDMWKYFVSVIGLGGKAKCRMNCSQKVPDDAQSKIMSIMLYQQKLKMCIFFRVFSVDFQSKS